MNPKELIAASLLCAGGFVFGGCNKPAPTPTSAPAVARVGDSIISAGDFARELQKRPSATPSEREEILREMIRTEALYAKAREAGFDKDPEIAVRLKRMVAGAYWDKMHGPEKSSTNSPADLREYYELHAKEFGLPERVHIAGLFWRVPQKATDEKKKEFQARADQILLQARTLPPTTPGFGDLARLNSEDQASRYQGGDLSWFTRQEAETRWGAEIARTLFDSLEKGSYSGIIPTTDGLWLFKFMDRQSPRSKALDEVKELIGYRLTKERQAAAAHTAEEKALAGVKIEIDRAMVDKISAAATNNLAAPPSMPR